MKPIKLEMTAFGSFKNHTVIDFSNFEKEVFLITGDTGAKRLYSMPLHMDFLEP